MAAPIVFMDIAGPNFQVQQEFYSNVFRWEIGVDGRFSAPVHVPLEAQIRQDPGEKRLYVGVPDIAQKLKEIVAHGGTVDVPRFEVPGVVVLGLFRDPAGNPMGLVEMEGQEVRIP